MQHEIALIYCSGGADGGGDGMVGVVGVLGLVGAAAVVVWVVGRGSGEESFMVRCSVEDYVIM